MPLQTLIDPLFSKKIHEVKVVTKSEQDLVAKIEELYASLEKNTALYYEGSAVGPALEAFASSEDFAFLIKQFEICFDQLIVFCDAQAIIITNGEAKIKASTLLKIFLEKLKTDFFSDRRALLYGPGKKYLEIISSFINEPAIDLDFRKLQIISLLSDEGLTHSCAEGCFTRLQYAANNLKNYDNFELPTLYQNYLLILADDIIHQPILMGRKETIAQKVAKWMQFNPVGFEIHVRNFILHKFKEKLNLESLETVQDAYINTIENFFKEESQKTKLLNNNLEYLLLNFNKRATATNFIKYLSALIYKSIPSQFDYMERVQFLEDKALTSFGQDKDFKLIEVFSDETGLLKDEHCLDITITERLINQGWLMLDWLKYQKNPFFQARNPQWLNLDPPFPPFSDGYKLFYGNLPLSWITVNTERQRIVSVLQQENGLQTIKDIYPNSFALLNTLIQTPEDLVTFFNQIGPSQQDTALDWIQSNPDFVHYVMGYYSTNKADDDLLEPLLSFLSQLESPKIQNIYITQFNLKDRLQTRVEKLSENNDMLDGVCSRLIKKTCGLHFIDFSNFIFYKNFNSDKSDISYLLDVDFSRRSMDNVKFFEDVYSSLFIHGEIDNTIFFGTVFNTDLTLAKLKDTHFKAPIENNFFDGATLDKVSFDGVFKTSFISASLVGVKFNKILSLSNLHKVKLTNAIFLDQVVQTDFCSGKLENILFNAKVTSSKFVSSYLLYLEFYESIVNSFFMTAYLTHVEFFADVIDSKFNFATLNEISFQKEINQSFFSNVNLRHVLFNMNICDSIFDYATGLEVDFMQSLISVSLSNLLLISGRFHGKVENCDFSNANLDNVHFREEIINSKFNNAYLEDVLFNGNLKNCEFIVSNFYAIDFYKIKLNTIKFIMVDFFQANFLESNLDNIQFTQTKLISAKFENSILNWVSFINANLEGSLFKKIQFKTHVHFFKTNLKNTYFSDCDLTLIDFHDSNLEHSILKASTITIRQLFDNFYSAGLRDFSGILLSKEDITKNEFLLIYAEKSLEQAILSESIFKGLAKLGYRNFEKTDLSHLKMDDFIHLYTNIEYNFSEAILPQIFLLPRSNMDVEEQSLSLSDCLPKQSRKKRNLDSCIVSWNDIDPFNLNTDDNRNFEEIIIDPINFVDTLFSTSNQKKQGKLVELIDTATIRGAAAPALVGLRATQQLKQHFYRVGNLGNSLQMGIIYEDIFMDFVHGDYQDVAINVGLLAGSGLSEKFAEQFLKQSQKLGLSGKVFLSKLLKLSAPFLRRGLTTGYIVYDLVKQAAALAKGNKNALINCIQDSVFITFDVLESEIEMLEFDGLDSEISELIKATGSTVNTLILGGNKVYYAARKVSEIKALIPLTPLQTLIEGLEAFLNINPSKKIQRQLEYNQAYAIYSAEIKDFLKNNPTIKYYVVPIIDLVGEYSYYKICGLSHGYPYMCNRDVSTHLEIILDSTIFLKKEAQSGLLFNELNPLKNNFEPEEIFCNPYRINFDLEKLTCDSALITLNPWSDEIHNQTLISLGEGYDIAYSFSDSPSIFIVDNDYKIYVGGNDNDRFVVKASSVKGRLDASSGSDLLDLRFYKADNKVITIDLVNQTLKEGDSEILTIRNFEQVLGRSHEKDLLFVAHRADFIDLQGGSELAYDEITITPNLRDINLEIVVRAQTLINNFAIRGNFIYRVPKIEKQLNDSTIHHTDLVFANYTNLMTNHTFLFDHDLEDLNSIRINQEVDEYDLLFNFVFCDEKPFANHSLILKNFPIHSHYFFKDDTRVKIGQKMNLYAFQTSSAPISNLLDRYAPLARRLGITLFIHQSLSNEVVVIGHANHQVLKNDLFANKTHLVANGGGNSYVLIPNKENPTPSVPDVVIYQLTTDETQHVLDLRELNTEFEGGLLDNPLIEVSIQRLAKDLQLKVLYKSLKTPEDIIKLTALANILLKQGTQWYPKLAILFNRVPLQLLEVEPNLWQLQPQPLNFDADHKNIILTIDDLEKDNKIFLNRPMEKQNWLRNGSDLWLTTLFSSTNYSNKNYTLLFKDFYSNEKKMQTIQLIFEDSASLLRDYTEEIGNAEDLEKKLTRLELSAWNELSKHRTIPEEQQNPTPLQSKVLDDRISQSQFFSNHVTSSATNLHHGWLPTLKQNVQKTLGQLLTTGHSIFNSSWRYVFSRKIEHNLDENENSLATNINISTPNVTWIAPSSLASPINIHFLGEQQNNPFQVSGIASYGNMNSGALQLIDLAIRKYYSQQNIDTPSVKRCSKQEKYFSSLFLQKRSDMAEERLQQALARYGQNH